MNLRPYQTTASDSVFSAWEENQSTLVVMPTGLGKTVLFADVIRRNYQFGRPGVSPRKPALVIAHREELIFQAKDKIRKVTGLPVEIEMAEQKVNSNSMFGIPPVVVSTIQTQTSGGDGGGRMAKFTPDQFGLLIIDEAHHATAGTYRRIIDYYRQNPDLRILGVTATPDRADESALGQVFDSVAFDYEILDAIESGWLVPIQQQMVSVEDLDFSNMRTTAGDLNGADLAAVMEFESVLHQVTAPSIEIIGNRRALVFASSVHHAERMCEIFNRHRDGMAAWVCGKTDKQDRRTILSDFSSGKTQVVCNCGVLTEGFDDPGVDVIVMARPTKSRSLYAQMVGRATRPLPGVVDGPETAEARKSAIAASRKQSCLIVDFVGNSGRHKLMTSADILGGNVSDEAIEMAITRAKKSGKPVDMSATLEAEEQLINERKKLEAANRAKLMAKAKFSSRNVNPFDVFEISPQKERGWDEGKKLTEKQRLLLSKQGIESELLSYTQGKQLLNEMFRRWDKNLCSFKQAKLLKKHGYDGNITRTEASAIIDALAKNNWQRI